MHVKNRNIFNVVPIGLVLNLTEGLSNEKKTSEFDAGLNVAHALRISHGILGGGS